MGGFGARTALRGGLSRNSAETPIRRRRGLHPRFSTERIPHDGESADRGHGRRRRTGGTSRRPLRKFRGNADKTETRSSPAFLNRTYRIPHDGRSADRGHGGFGAPTALRGGLSRNSAETPIRRDEVLTGIFQTGSGAPMWRSGRLPGPCLPGSRLAREASRPYSRWVTRCRNQAWLECRLGGTRQTWARRASLLHAHRNP